MRTCHIFLRFSQRGFSYILAARDVWIQNSIDKLKSGILSYNGIATNLLGPLGAKQNMKEHTTSYELEIGSLGTQLYYHIISTL